MSDIIGGPERGEIEHSLGNRVIKVANKWKLGEVADSARKVYRGAMNEVGDKSVTDKAIAFSIAFGGAMEKAVEVVGTAAPGNAGGMIETALDLPKLPGFDDLIKMVKDNPFQMGTAIVILSSFIGMGVGRTVGNTLSGGKVFPTTMWSVACMAGFPYALMNWDQIATKTSYYLNQAETVINNMENLF
jgi:hypothetical protein